MTKVVLLYRGGTRNKENKEVKGRGEVIYVERSGQGMKMGEVENVAWQMRMVCVAPVCLSTKNVSSVTCSILADSGAGFSRQNTQAPAKAHC